MSQAPKLTYFDSYLRFKNKRFHAFLLKNRVLLQGMVGALALALAVLARPWLEASMWRHMVLQFPLLLLTGAAWAGALPPAWQGRSINQYVITGWVAASSILAVLMIPRVLDLALLRQLGVVVIPDGFGDYEHNAALLVFDAQGRMVRVFDLAEQDLALNYARHLARQAQRTSAQGAV